MVQVSGARGTLCSGQGMRDHVRHCPGDDEARECAPTVVGVCGDGGGMLSLLVAAGEHQLWPTSKPEEMSPLETKPPSRGGGSFGLLLLSVLNPFPPRLIWHVVSSY